MEEIKKANEPVTQKPYPLELKLSQSIGNQSADTFYACGKAVSLAGLDAVTITVSVRDSRYNCEDVRSCVKEICRKVVECYDL